MIKVKIMLDENAVLPMYAKPGDSGVDLFTVNEVMIQPGDTKILSTGIHLGMPEGIEAQIRPRSGLSSKTKLRVTLGTGDQGYIGEIKIIIDNISQVKDPQILNLEGYRIAQTFEVDENYYDRGTYVIPAGAKMAQIVFAYVAKVDFEQVLELEETERGSNGFGHTGN